jgi:hypothetical protein
MRSPAATHRCLSPAQALRAAPFHRQWQHSGGSFYVQPLHFFDLDDGFPLVGPAIQTRVMRQLEFVALWAHGHTGRRDPKFLCPALVASGSRMLMFRIRHRLSSSNQSRSVFCGSNHPDRRRWRFSGTLARPLVQIFPASRTQPGAIVPAERLHRRS